MAVDAYDSPVDDDSKEPLLPPPSSYPPPYQPASPSSTPAIRTAGVSDLKRVAPPLRPCNYFTVQRKGGGKVSGSLVIDPTAKIPAHLLAPLAAGVDAENRPNLDIKVPEDKVDIDVWIRDRSLELVPDASVASSSSAPPPNPLSPVTIHVQGRMVHLRLHDLGGGPCTLIVKGLLTTRLGLPRSFQGALTIHSRHSVPEFSEAMAANVTTFYESDADKDGCKYLRKCFVGDYGGARPDLQGDDARPHMGNTRKLLEEPDSPPTTVDVSSPGDTFIYYADEQLPTPSLASQWRETLRMHCLD